MKLRAFILACLVYGYAAIDQSVIDRLETMQQEMSEEWDGAEKTREATQMDGLLIKLLETKVYRDLTPRGKELAEQLLPHPSPQTRRPLTRTTDRPVRTKAPRPTGHEGSPAPEMIPQTANPEHVPEHTTTRWTRPATSTIHSTMTTTTHAPIADPEVDIFAILENTEEAQRIVDDAWETETPVPTEAAATSRPVFTEFPVSSRKEKGNRGVFGPAGAAGPRGGRPRIIPPTGSSPTVSPTDNEVDNGGDTGGKLTPEKKAKKVQELLDGEELSDLPVRKEYRCMSGAERTKFHDAINLLKQQRIGNSNAYDTFLLFHHKTFAKGAYQGPGFLPWHRHFLWLFEKALREVSKDNTLTLPYWDSSADADIPNPLTSALWRDSHMGTSSGNVVDGPFADWSTATGLPLQRQVSGDPTLLYNEEVFQYILAAINYGRVADVLELTHTGPHAYVGGQMANFSTSVSDPLFFMHLAFVDCLWEEWRGEMQYSKGVNPEEDYPEDTDLPVHHKVTSQMRPFAITNKAGLARVYTSLYYKYQPRNSCPEGKCGCDRYGRDCDEAPDSILRAWLATAPPFMRDIFSAVPDSTRDTCT